LDLTVQQGIQNLLESLSSKFSLGVTVVIDGIRPKCTVDKNAALTKSAQLWNAAKEADAAKSVFAKIVENYGSRFY
jgi:hypothetical protein